ncbi:MAG: DnaA regulatory inactivator Hda [Gammaproteobacteria bacterium]|nr:DnaA regulatory inactivator Hda [Gammaproteobacteria bacterium]
MSSQQLVLNLSVEPDAVFDRFNAAGNELLVDMLQKVAYGQGEKQVYFWTPGAHGKSHLLQSACHACANLGGLPAYLPLKTLIKAGPHIMEGFESASLICIDDAHLVASRGAWETAFFDLINRVRQQGIPLLITSSQRPAELYTLPDLISRLGWGVVINLKALDEQQVRLTLIARAQKLGITLPENVVNYLLVHFPRNIAAQMACLSQLAELSLVEKRVLTVPFVKKTLQNS